MTRLDEIREREKKATDGPWISNHVGTIYGGVPCREIPITYNDSNFIAHSRSDIKLLLEVAEAALKLNPWCEHTHRHQVGGMDELRAVLAKLTASS